jgi:DNA-binding beta-propeller fold protein YncE
LPFFADGPLATAGFNFPGGVAPTPDGSVVYVCDTFNFRVRVLNRTAGVVTTLAGSGLSAYADGAGATAGFALPRGMRFDHEKSSLLVADSSNKRIRAVSTATGETTTLAGTGASSVLSGPALAQASFETVRLTRTTLRPPAAPTRCARKSDL